jgi:hypothetical protein
MRPSFCCFLSSVLRPPTGPPYRPPTSSYCTSACYVVPNVSLTSPVDRPTTYNNFQWPSNWTPWWNQPSTVWPNQPSAPWPNQTNAPLANPYHPRAPGRSNGFPVSVTNSNYYPVWPNAFACATHVPLLAAWPTAPGYWAAPIPTGPIPAPLVLPAAAPPVVAWNTPVPAWNAWPAAPSTAPRSTLTLHPMLCSTPVAYPHLSWSIGQFVSSAQICTHPNSERSLTDAELIGQAVPPSISEICIRLNHRWVREWQERWGPIVVPRYSSQGIRVEDVVQGIFNFFQTPLMRVEVLGMHPSHRGHVMWEAERRARELPNGGISSQVERNKGLLRIDLVRAAAGGLKFAGMQPMGGWTHARDFSLNLTN